MLVFAQFEDVIENTENALKAAGVRTLKMQGTVHQQTKTMERFKTDNELDALLLMSCAESASGANLTCANHAIFVHKPLCTTTEEYEASVAQAVGRVRRYGQTRPVNVWNFLADDTVDTLIN
jgi:SNF2 family DNA or RNA helicase